MFRKCPLLSLKRSISISPEEERIELYLLIFSLLLPEVGHKPQAIRNCSAVKSVLLEVEAPQKYLIYRK